VPRFTAEQIEELTTIATEADEIAAANEALRAELGLDRQR
jgi:hypothetical protein